MTNMPSEDERLVPGHGINPVKTVLIRTVGTLIVVTGAGLFAFWAFLWIVWAGSEPLWRFLIGSPVIWLSLLMVASGVGLVLHAWRRHRYLQGRE